MDYLVLITGDPYYFWQIELLIESFRFHNMEKNLVIGIRSDTNEISLPPNASGHERKFIFRPQSHKYEPLNKIYGIYAAVVAKSVTQPFAIIHPDMVLMQPIPNFTEEVVFHVTPEDTEVKKIVCPDASLPWMCIDGAAVFNGFPVNALAKVFTNAQELSSIVPVEKLGKAAWAKTMYQFHDLFNFYGTQLEVDLLQHQAQSCLIHYRQGMLPYFSKLHYKHFGFIEMDQNPFSALIENNPTSVTDFVRNIALLYLNDRRT